MARDSSRDRDRDRGDRDRDRRDRDRDPTAPRHLSVVLSKISDRIKRRTQGGVRQSALKKNIKNK
jgi:hypothetical protein